MANIMIRRGSEGYVFYMPKRDIEDKIVSTHRGHGHCLAKGCDVDGSHPASEP